MIVSLEEVNKIYNGNVLFEHINAKIEDADRIGLIGPNGAGKTTLLRLICREESADTVSLQFPTENDRYFTPKQRIEQKQYDY